MEERGNTTNRAGYDGWLIPRVRNTHLSGMAQESSALVPFVAALTQRREWVSVGTAAYALSGFIPLRLCTLLSMDIVSFIYDFPVWFLPSIGRIKQLARRSQQRHTCLRAEPCYRPVLPLQNMTRLSPTAV